MANNNDLKFFQYKDEPAIYKGKLAKDGQVVELHDPFRSEEEFIVAGGTPYWKPGFTGVSNVEILDRPAAPAVPSAKATLNAAVSQKDGGIRPEDTLAGVRSVFGPGWRPSPAFTPELQRKGIFGAVRVAGSPNVFTIGPGGGLETPESFQKKFGTLEQKGIVEEITREQAIALGITSTAVDAPPAPTGAISIDQLGETEEIDLAEAGAYGDAKEDLQTDTDVVQAAIQQYIDIQKALKTGREKKLEAERGELAKGIKKLIGEAGEVGALQLEEEEKREIEAKQEAVDDADGALQVKMAEVNALDAQYQAAIVEIEGKPISMLHIQGDKAQAYRMYAAKKNVLLSEASLLQARTLALQKKLSSAQAAADRAVDLKYKDLRAQIDAQTTFLELVEGELSAEQKIRADAMKNYYDNLQDTIDEEKDREKVQYNTLLDQMQRYPDAGITLEDTLEEANAKITGVSRIYQQATRFAGGAPGAPTRIPAPSQSTFTTPDDEQVDLGTIAGIKRLMELRPGTTRGELWNMMIEQAGINQTVAKQLLDEAGLTEEAEMKPTQTMFNIFRQYKDAGYSREDLEVMARRQYKIEEGEELPQIVTDILDNLYGRRTSWWQRTILGIK